MAFGDIKATAGNAVASITNPFSASAAVTVALGNLIVVTIMERGSKSVTGVSDNLGNTFTALNSSAAGNATLMRYYSIVTVAGSSTVSVACTASSSDGTLDVTVYEGPFAVSPLDKDPTMTASPTSPYAGPATGTLTQANNLIVGQFSNSNGTSPYTSPTPTGARLDNQHASGTANGTGSCCTTSIVVSATTTVTMGISGTSTNQGNQGVAVFKQGAAAKAIPPFQGPRRIWPARRFLWEGYMPFHSTVPSRRRERTQTFGRFNRRMINRSGYAASRLGRLPKLVTRLKKIFA